MSMARWQWALCGGAAAELELVQQGRFVPTATGTLAPRGPPRRLQPPARRCRMFCLYCCGLRRYGGQFLSERLPLCKSDADAKVRLDTISAAMQMSGLHEQGGLPMRQGLPAVRDGRLTRAKQGSATMQNGTAREKNTARWLGMGMGGVVVLMACNKEEGGTGHKGGEVSACSRV